MFRIVFIDNQGLIKTVARVESKELYSEDEYYAGSSVKYIPALMDTLTDDELLRYYFKNDELKQLPEKPSQYHIWNLEIEQWQEPEGYLETIRRDAVSQINQLAGQKITAVYPITKQNYLQGRYIELMMLGQTDSEEAKAIAAAWQFLKAVKDASDEANVRVNQADTLEVITAVVDEFKLFNI